MLPIWREIMWSPHAYSPLMILKCNTPICTKVLSHVETWLCPKWIDSDRHRNSASTEPPFRISIFALLPATMGLGREEGAHIIVFRSYVMIFHYSIKEDGGSWIPTIWFIGLRNLVGAAVMSESNIREEVAQGQLEIVPVEDGKITNGLQKGWNSQQPSRVRRCSRSSISCAKCRACSQLHPSFSHPDDPTIRVFPLITSVKLWQGYQNKNTSISNPKS